MADEVKPVLKVMCLRKRLLKQIPIRHERRWVDPAQSEVMGWLSGKALFGEDTWGDYILSRNKAGNEYSLYRTWPHESSHFRKGLAELGLPDLPQIFVE